MPSTNDDSDVISVTNAKGRAGNLDPQNCEITATVYNDHVRVRIDSGSDPTFWMEFGFSLKGTPAAPTETT
jgi:hypothetical protein